MEIGRKADSLIKMKELGLPVPLFIVVKASLFKSYSEGPKELVEEELRSIIQTFLKTSDSKTWIVRSASSIEDGTQDSFAGLFDSFGGLNSENEIFDAVIKCWKSAHSERVISYAARKGISLNGLSMSVIIQDFIEADFSGVLFTAHPLKGDDLKMYLEICRGQGERLVSGHVTPDQIEISWQSPVRIHSHVKNESVQLSETVLSALQNMGQIVQESCGCPQDIEFAVKNEKIYLVQSRAITKIQFQEGDEEWTTADFRDGGISSDVVSPIMWGLYESIFSRSLPSYFQKIKLLDEKMVKQTQWYKIHFARAYWNLKAVKDVMSQVPGFNEKNFDEDMSIPVGYDGQGRRTSFTLSGIIRIVPVAFALENEFKRQMKRSQNLLAHFHQTENYYKNINLSNLQEEDLLKNFRKLIEVDYFYVESEYFQTIYNASNAKMELLSSLKPLQKIDPSIQYIRLIADLGELEALAPAREMQKIAEKYSSLKDSFSREKIDGSNEDFNQAIRTYIDRFYYHSPRELDLRVPRWGEDLQFTLNTLYQLMNSTQRKPNSSRTFEVELEKLKSAYAKSRQRWFPWSWNSLMSKLERIREFLRLREEIRCQSTKMYFFIRQFLLEISNRLLPISQQSLIFYAHHNEVIDLCLKKISIEEFVKKANERKRYALGYSQYVNPNEIGYRYNFSRTDVAKNSQRSAFSYLTGIGCSAGVIRAKACVCLDIHQAQNLKQGEILVTRFTDPGWTPLLSLAGGVVCENGGLLSHAALISREYGIPSVLNVRNATSLIRNGQEIEIDGSKGQVSIL